LRSSRAIFRNALFTLAADFEQENASKRAIALADASFFCCGFSRLTSTLESIRQRMWRAFRSSIDFAIGFRNRALRTSSQIQHHPLGGLSYGNVCEEEGSGQEGSQEGREKTGQEKGRQEEVALPLGSHEPKGATG
jgi:hypothetical protein